MSAEREVSSVGAEPARAPSRATARPRTPFRRRDALHVRSLHFGPNMTPMVDVVMVILVFFMASAAFVGPEWFLRSLIARPAPATPSSGSPTPGAGADPLKLAALQVRVALSVDDGGTTRASILDRVNVSVDEAIARLRELVAGVSKDDVEVLVRAAAQVPYSDVVRVHEAAGELGVRVGVEVR